MEKRNEVKARGAPANAKSKSETKNPRQRGAKGEEVTF
jgi:hypothetical protein